MQIERKPSRWPYVGALIGLLLFCLTVPEYWRSASEQAEQTANATTGTRRDERAGAPFVGHAFQHLSLPTSAGIPLSLLPQNCDFSDHFSKTEGGPTTWQSHAVAELLDILHAGATHGVGNNLHGAHGRGASFSLGSSANALDWPSAGDEPDGSTYSLGSLPEPLLALILQRFGESLIDHPRDLVAWAPRITKLFQYWSFIEALVRNDSIVPDQSDSLLLTSPVNDDFAVEGSGPWTTPGRLVTQLSRLTEYPYSARWAEQTLALVTALTREAQPNQDLTNALLRRLASSADEAVRLADECRDGRLRAELLRAHWSLARRLDCWAVLHDIRVAALEKRRVATRGSLDAMFAGPPLPEEIPASARALNADLERYEESGDPALARTIADSRNTLEKSSDDLERSLAGAVERHYRNANIRVAVTAEMINRFIGQERSQDAEVRDRIAGAPVFGHSHTLTESRVKLQPDTGRWRMELEADGHVDSSTRSDGGPAQLYSQGETDFVARKAIVVAPEGVRMEPTVVDAYNRNRVVGVTTDFDWVPLFGSYARNMAMNQYRTKRMQAKSEVEYKVAARAMEQLDRESLERIERVEQDLRGRVVEPLERSGIEITAVELTSTNERVMARLRVAGDYQLAGHTPRPRALSDSLASAQIHETAVTNAAVALGLDGQQFTAPALQAKLRESFPKLAVENPPETHEETTFHFAYQDAIQVRIADGKMELLIGVDDFHQGGRRIRGFIVHAFYVPVVNGLEVELAREGALGFEGRLSSADRARLHSVFKEVLSEDRRFPILKLDNPDDPRLAGLMITQLVLEDGWLGMAIGPEANGRVAERSRTLK